MKKENIERVNELVKYIDELDLILNSFEPGTAAGTFIESTNSCEKSEDSLLYINLQISGRGNTAGNTAQQKFNGVIGNLDIQQCKEYKEMKDELTNYITSLYLQKCKELKKEFEKELSFL